jgi:hypothetical protein
MTQEHEGARTRTSRVIKARCAELYADFMDPEDNEAGSRLSLEQLARRFETNGS